MNFDAFYIACNYFNNAYHAESNALDLIEFLRYFNSTETIIVEDFVFETGHGPTYEYFEERELKQYTIDGFIEYFTLLTEKAPVNEIYVVSLNISFKNVAIWQHEGTIIYSVENSSNIELANYLSYIFNQYKITEQTVLIEQVLASEEYFLFDVTGKIIKKVPNIEGIWGWY